MLSNESVQSEYCQAEFEEAQRLQKCIVTVQARDRTRLGDELSSIQYIDMKPGVNEADAYTRLYKAISLCDISRKPPLWKPRTPKPAKAEEPTREERDDVDTPTLKSIQRNKIKESKTPSVRELLLTNGARAFFVFIVFVITLLIAAYNGMISFPAQTPTYSEDIGATITTIPSPTISPDLGVDTELCVLTGRRLSDAAVDDEVRQSGEFILEGTIVFTSENARGDFYSNQYYHISTGATSGWFPISGLTDDLSYCSQDLFTETAEAATVAPLRTMEAATMEARDGIPLIGDNLQRRTEVCVIEDSSLWLAAETDLQTGYTVQTDDRVIIERVNRDVYEFGEYYHIQNRENLGAHGWIHKSKLTGDLSYCE